MAKSQIMYKDSPTTKRGADGKVGVSRPTQADNENAATAGNPLPGAPESGDMALNVHQANERHEIHHKHVAEHLDTHRRHESEHMSHKGGDKAEMHKRHEKEMKEMHDRHHTEIVSMHKRHAEAAGPPESEMAEAKPHSSKVE